MKWYQHESECHNDEKIRELIHEHGVEGYGVYHVCLEIISEKIDDKLIARVEISDRVLCEKLRLKSLRVERILNFCTTLSLISAHKSECLWIIQCDPLLKRIDNWTQKKVKRYVVTTEQVPLQQQQEHNKNTTTTTSNAAPKPAAGSFFKDDQMHDLKATIAKTMGWSVMSDAVSKASEEIIHKVKTSKKKLENPFGYAMGIAQKLNGVRV